MLKPFIIAVALCTLLTACNERSYKDWYGQTHHKSWWDMTGEDEWYAESSDAFYGDTLQTEANECSVYGRCEPSSTQATGCNVYGYCDE